MVALKACVCKCESEGAWCGVTLITAEVQTKWKRLQMSESVLSVFFSLLLTEKNSFNRTVPFWVSSTLIVYLKLYWKHFHWVRLFWNIFELNCCPRLSPAVVTFAFLTWFRPRGHVNIHKYDRWMHECMLSRTMEGTKHFHLHKFTLLFV